MTCGLAFIWKEQKSQSSRLHDRKGQGSEHGVMAELLCTLM